jgi:hypothetical protein
MRLVRTLIATRRKIPGTVTAVSMETEKPPAFVEVFVLFSIVELFFKAD